MNNQIFFDECSTGENRTVIERSINIDLTSGICDISYILDDFLSILSAIRICCTGPAHITSYAIIPTKPGSLFVPPAGFQLPFNHPVPIIMCHIHKKHVPSILTACKWTMNSSIPSSIKVAINRLDYVFERRRLEDQFIDAFIALEALYGDGAGAASYKIAMRCAACIGASKHECVTIAEDIIKLYQTRSALVHGSLKSTSRSEAVKAAERLLEYVRSSLEYFMSSASKDGHFPTSRALDTMMLKSISAR